MGVVNYVASQLAAMATHLSRWLMAAKLSSSLATAAISRDQAYVPLHEEQSQQKF